MELVQGLCLSESWAGHSSGKAGKLKGTGPEALMLDWLWSWGLHSLSSLRRTVVPCHSQKELVEGWSRFKDVEKILEMRILGPTGKMGGHIWVEEPWANISILKRLGCFNTEMNFILSTFFSFFLMDWTQEVLRSLSPPLLFETSLNQFLNLALNLDPVFQPPEYYHT